MHLCHRRAPPAPTVLFVPACHMRTAMHVLARYLELPSSDVLPPTAAPTPAPALSSFTVSSSSIAAPPASSATSAPLPSPASSSLTAPYASGSAASASPASVSGTASLASGEHPPVGNAATPQAPPLLVEPPADTWPPLRLPGTGRAYQVLFSAVAALQWDYRIPVFVFNAPSITAP